MNTTNLSGKFAPAMSFATTNASTANDHKTPVDPIPPTPPAPEDGETGVKPLNTDAMMLLREYLGRLWWLWIVVVVWWLVKEK